MAEDLPSDVAEDAAGGAIVRRQDRQESPGQSGAHEAHEV